MNSIVSNVLVRKQDIINRSMEYEKLSTNHVPHDYSKEYRKLYDFFDNNFNDDEIMVIQSIMYFGRECFCHDNYNCGNSTDEIISYWMKELYFSFGKQIEKDIEIHQMVGKGLKIGTYYKYGFENLK